MNDVTFFDDPQLDTAVALVFELASQLHTERQERRALEELLVREGVITRDAIDALAGDDDFRVAMEHDLEHVLDRLFRIVGGDGPPQHPLRSEAADPGSHEHG